MVKFSSKGLENFLTDSVLEASDGVWFELPGDRKICCLRAGGANKKFRREFDRAIRPYRREMDRGTMDPDLSNRLLLDVYTRAVFVDWEGFVDEFDADVPFSSENARAFFEQFPDLLDYIVDKVTDATSFVDRELQEGKTSSVAA